MRRLAVAAWLLTLPAGCAPQAIRGALDVDPDPDAPGAPGQVDPEATTPRARAVALTPQRMVRDAPAVSQRPAPPQAPPPPPPPPPPAAGAAGPDLTRCAPPLPIDAPDVTYVCDCQAGADPACVPGADTNPGTAQAPLQTFTAAMSRFNQLTSGQAVALCRGGAWQTADNRVRRTACSADDRCVLGDYTAPWGDGGEAAPALTLSNPTGNLISMDSGSGVTVEGLEVRNLTLRGPGIEGVGIFVYREINHVKLSCMDLSGFDIAINIHAWGTDVVLEDAVVHDNGGHGWLGGCNACGIRRARFDNNGAGWAAVGRGSLAHNVYVSGGSTGMFVESVHSTRSAVDDQGACTGIPITAHGGVMHDLRIVGNLIEEPNAGLGCWGISVDSASMDPDGNRRALIANNVLVNVGNVGIGLASCEDCTVENNVIVQERIGGMRAIVMPVRQRSADDLASDRVVVRHNTVYFAGGGQGTGVAVGGEGSAHVVANNIVAFTGQSGECYRLDLASDAYAGLDGNLCFGGTMSPGSTGLDGLTLVADPQFVAAPEDLSLSASSPAVDSGDPSQATDCDLMGQPRDAHPDRGAYER